MRARLRSGTFAAGLLITLLGAVLLTEGLGWWELHRAELPYLVPVILILMGAAAISSGLSKRLQANGGQSG